MSERMNEYMSELKKKRINGQINKSKKEQIT